MSFLSRLYTASRLDTADLADTLDLATLHAEAFPPGWSASEIEALVAQDSVITLVARRGPALAARRPVGFLMVRHGGGEAEVLTLAVAAGHRRRGIGRRLLEEMLRRLYFHRIERLYLEVNETNAAARALYARLGFGDAGRRPNYYAAEDGRRTAALVLFRELQ